MLCVAVVHTMVHTRVHAAAPVDSTEWLTKITRAAMEVSFSGTFIYVNDGEIETTEAVRRVTAEGINERFYSLNGAAREVVRDQHHIWCYLPEDDADIHDRCQVSESSFPHILPDDMARLHRYYRFTADGVERIADRIAQRIEVQPNDDHRYGYRLWVDQETGLLLRSDLLAEDDTVMEQFMFVTIRLGHKISDHALKPLASSDKLAWQGERIPASNTADTTATRSSWSFRNLPAGYRLSKHLHRTSATEGRKREHLIFTDGLSMISVFIKQDGDGQSIEQGLSRRGTMHIYHDVRHEHRITVMGEVPARTVKLLATGVAYDQ